MFTFVIAASVRLLVDRDEGARNPFDIRVSDVDVLLELKPEGKVITTASFDEQVFAELLLGRNGHYDWCDGLSCQRHKRSRSGPKLLEFDYSARFANFQDLIESPYYLTCGL